MAETTDVRKSVRIVVLVSWRTGSFEIHHDLFPTFTVDWLNSHTFLFGWPFPEPDARQAFLNPRFDIRLHRVPIDHSLHYFERFRSQFVSPEDSDVSLQETPPFPCHVGCCVPFRHDWNPHTRSVQAT